MNSKAIAVDDSTFDRFPVQASSQLGAYLRALRKARQLTQAQFGEMLGVTRARVSEIERDPANLGFSQLQRILHLLGGRLVIEVASAEPSDRPAPAPTTPRGEW